MRRSRGQVFVLARDKVADFHTRGSHWRKMHEMQLMSVLRWKETIGGKFQADRTPSLGTFWLLVAPSPPPTFKYKQGWSEEAASPPVSTILLPPGLSQAFLYIFFSPTNTVFPLCTLRIRCLLWFLAAHVSYCATLAADAERQTSWRRCHPQKINIDFSNL